MPSDYEQICKDNIRRRGEEFDDIGRLISEQLYSDRTHFIYELLQNAEDALGRRKRNNPESELPTNVKFLLYKDRLEFRHFGENFNTNDVKGISDVLKGTKSEDKTQIGKFGIGFKSVYAFTSTPEIHSGDEHFIIERYIRPRSADRTPQIADGETVFVFPFNHKDLSKEQAFQLIEEKLKKIGSRVLLFLRNITEIEWKIEDQEEGLYLKESKQQGRFAQRVTVIGQHGNEDEEEEWLVFRRQIEVVNSSAEGFVEVAFRLIEDKKEGKEIIRRIESSPLVVYFPTKLETRLGFLVHGPFDTTASRSDIEDNEWNRGLIIETADLLTETALPWLKGNTLLTSSILEALPIKPDDFPQGSLFRPIYEVVRTTLRNREFLPAANGGYISGKRAVLARAEDLVKIISSEQLSTLLNKGQKLDWLTTDITETKKDIHRYLVGWKPSYWDTGEEIESLIVAEVRPQDLIEKLTSGFLKEQSNTWLLKLYAFFEKRPALINKLKNKPVVRLEDGSHVIPFKQDGSPNAYLPPENDTEFKVVSREISKDEKALEFLKKLGLTKPDAVAEVIEHILPKYKQSNPDISDDEHRKDIKKILKAYKTDSQKKKKRLIEQLQTTKFIITETPHIKTTSFRKPIDAYFWSNELEVYFAGSNTVGFVRPDFYHQSVLALFEDLGVTDKIRIRCKSKNGSVDYVQLEYKNGYRRGIRGFDPDIQIDGIQYAMMNPSGESSKIIWNDIAVKYSHCIKGKLLRSSRQDFSPNASVYEEEELTSNFGRLLMDTPWLPDKQGNFHKPAELKLDDLPESFVRDEKLANQLGMKKDVVAKLAEESGIPLNALEQAKKYTEAPPEVQKQIDSLLSRHDRQQPEFPQRSSADPDRRRERLVEQMNDAPEKEYEQRNRSVRVSANTIDKDTYLRNAYTNDDGQMVCQICKNEMPFRKRDGEYYFEAVEALSRDYFAKEHEAQFLALCPLCAAMYKEFIKNDEKAMESMKNALINSENAEVPLQLGELDTSIRFVETHFLDIKEILKRED